MKAESVRADIILPGDYILVRLIEAGRKNRGRFDRVRVRAVEPCITRARTEHGGVADVPAVRVHTHAWHTVYLAAEGVSVVRGVR